MPWSREEKIIHTNNAFLLPRPSAKTNASSVMKFTKLVDHFFVIINYIFSVTYLYMPSSRQINSKRNPSMYRCIIPNLVKIDPAFFKNMLAENEQTRTTRLT